MNEAGLFLALCVQIWVYSRLTVMAILKTENYIHGGTALSTTRHLHCSLFECAL